MENSIKGFALLCLLLFVASTVNAQTNTTGATVTANTTVTTATPALISACPTNDQVLEKIERCAAAGLGYETQLLDNQCKDVVCSQRTVCADREQLSRQANECEEKGLRPSYNTAKDGCTFVTCYTNTTDLSCESKETLDKRAIECKAGGYGYTYSRTANGCVAVECTKPTTCVATAEQMEVAARRCSEAGGQPSRVYDATGCLTVQCGTTTCPDSSTLERQISVCRTKGIGAITYADAAGCKQAKCDDGVKVAPADVTCRKVQDGDCTVIKCDDGFYSNSCTQKEVCYAFESKSYVDSEGCKVIVWNNGREERVCPTGNVKCDVVKKENGCEVKECTDSRGNTTRSEYCAPEAERCRVTIDDKGCQVKTCVDAEGKEVYSARSCEDKVKKENVECKLYKVGDAWETSCDNGLVINYAKVEAGCRAEGKVFNLNKLNTSITCKYGENQQYVVRGNPSQYIQCLANTADGTRLCTDSTSMQPEEGGVMAKAETGATTQTNTGFDLGRFLRGIFGLK